MAIFEAPGEQEEKQGTPLVGKAGFAFHRMLQRGKLDRDDFKIANCLSCRPPGNVLRGASYEHAALDHCSPILNQIIDEMKPKCIVAGGDTALNRLLGMRGITDCRGYAFWSDRYQTWILPTFHPAYILRGKSALAAVFIHDLQRAVEIAKDGHQPYPVPPEGYLLDPTPAEFEGWIDKMIETGMPYGLSVDIETPDKDTDEGELAARMEEDEDADMSYVILRIGFCAFHGEAVSIPFEPAYRPLVQRLLNHPCRKIFWNCPTPDQRVLTADLRWVQAGDLKVGDRLVSIDEERETGHRARRCREGTVTVAERMKSLVFAVHFSDGTVVKTTADHKWLYRGVRGPHARRVTGWIETCQLKVGMRLFRFLDPWDFDDSRSGGYLAGMFDGEGHLSRNTGTKSLRMGVTQRVGPTLDRIAHTLRAKGLRYTATYTPSRERDKHIGSLMLLSRREMAFVLGSIRPQRLLDKFTPDMLGTFESWSRQEDVAVTAIEPLGVQEIVGLSVDCHTYILEGFGAHNCGFDVPRIRAAGFDINGAIHDGMIAWHILNSDLPKGLGSVTTYFMPRQSMWKHLSKESPAYYNAVDNDAALHNTVGIEGLLKKHKMWGVYETHILDIDPITSAMSAAGMPIDADRRRQAAQKLTTLLDDCMTRMHAAVPLEALDHSPKGGYVKEPDDKSGMTSFSTWTTVKRCSRCWTANPKKPHFKEYKKKLNPCAGASIIESREVTTRWARIIPFAVSPKRIYAYQDVKKHKKVMTGRGRDRKPTTDKKAIKTLMANYPTDPLYPLILEQRELKKLGGTYCGLLDAQGNVVKGMPVGRDGRVHTTFTVDASTLRFTSKGPNLQNTPRAGSDPEALVRLVKWMFVAGAGTTFIEVDFSGIEAVLVGWFAGSQRYTRLAKLGVHDFLNAHILLHRKKLLASDMPDLAWTDQDLKACFKDLKARFKPEREVAKRVVHLSNYMGTPMRMHFEYPETFHATKDARELQQLYFNLFPEITTWHAQTCLATEKTCIARNPFGYVHRFYSILDWRKEGHEWKWSYGDDAKRLIAFGPQSTAAGIMKSAMKRIWQKYEDIRPDLRLTIHDSLLCEVADNRVDSVRDRVVEEMEQPIPELPLDPTWNMGSHLSIGVEAKIGKSWEAMK